MVIPYCWADELYPHTYRLRRDHPELRAGQDGQFKPEAKYLAPLGDGNRLYIPPGLTLEQLQDVEIPIVIVEGEKKALALWRLANHEKESQRFIPIAISGVWNWRGKIGKTTGPNSERIDVKGPIADLNRILWNNRKVFVVFDANVHTNDSVQWSWKNFSKTKNW